MLALEWLKNAHGIMEKLEATQLENIKKAATVMADSIETGRWVHTFGCGHATIPVEEMYPRIGSFVGFHPLCELPLTFFTQIIGQMGIHQFLFLERAEGYGQEIMKNYDFDSKDCMWIFSHTGINAVNIDMALEAKKRGMKVIVYGSASETGDKASRHSSGKNLFQLADIVVDSCVGRRLRTFEEPLRQGRSVVYIEFRHHGMDDHHYRCRNPCRPWRTLVHPSVAQRSG